MMVSIYSVIRNGLCEPMDVVCPTHGKYKAFVTKINGEDIIGECDKCAEARIQQEREERNAVINKRIEQAGYNPQLRKACIPPRFLDRTFDNFVITKESEEVISIMKRYATNFDRVKQNGTSLLITGGTATGKTHIACAIANAVIRKGYTAYYVSCLNFLSAVKRAWTSNSEVSEDELIDSFACHDLLVIDELGKGTLDAKEKGMLFRLIDKRYESAMPTIGISNLEESRLKSLLDDDFVRRLKSGKGMNVRFTWKGEE